MDIAHIRQLIAQGENTNIEFKSAHLSMASVHELLRLFQQSGMFHFDSTPVENTSVRNLNFQKIAAYFEPYQLSFDLLSKEENI